MVNDPHADVMNLLRARLEPFKVPNEVVRQLRDDIMDTLTPKNTKKNGAAVMTPEASRAGDLLRQGKLDDPKTARPKIV